MNNYEKIIKSFEIRLLKEIAFEYEKNNQEIKIHICDADENEQYKEYAKILNFLISKGVIKDFQWLSNTKRSDFINPFPDPPVQVEKELDPLVMIDYQRDYIKAMETEAIYGGDYPCHAVVIERKNINIRKIQSLLNKIIASSKKYNQPIKTVEIVKKGEGYIIVYINKDYNNKIFPDAFSDDSYWGILCKIAEEKKCRCKDNSDVKKYFNSNSNNPIYSNTGCLPTKLLQQRGKLLYPSSEVEIKIILKETINRSQGQTKNRRFRR